MHRSIDEVFNASHPGRTSAARARYQRTRQLLRLLLWRLLNDRDTKQKCLVIGLRANAEVRHRAIVS